MAVAVDRLVGSSALPGVSDVVATIPGWWARRAQAVGLPPSWRNWRLALPEAPVPLYGSPAEHLYDAGPFEIGEAYVRALDPSTRLREGRHYTPELLAEALWREIEAAGASEGLIVDPACGAGALLLPPLRRFIQPVDDPATALAAVPSRFAGTDLDPVGVWLGNALLNAELLPLWARLPEAGRPRLPQILRVADGLTPANDSPQVLVMNPPYGRVRLPHAARLRWQESLYGHANRYALFLHAAVERVGPGGLIAAVVPASFLGGAYYQRLRAFLVKEAPLVRLTFVDARSGVFVGDVLQETCLAIFRKGARPGVVECAQLAVNGAVERAQLPKTPWRKVSTSLPWLLPRQRRDRRLIAAAARLEARLSDYGWKASTGPLVWNRHKGQIFASQGVGRLPIIWAADLDGGAIRRDPARDQQRWIALRDRDEFMKLTESAVLVQRTTAPEQPRRLVAAELDEDTLVAWGGTVVAENHVNVLRCSDPESPLTPRLLTALLRTTTFDRLYRCLTGTIAVSAYELEALPLPPARTLKSWQKLADDQLAEVVVRYYADESP